MLQPRSILVGLTATITALSLAACGSTVQVGEEGQALGGQGALSDPTGSLGMPKGKRAGGGGALGGGGTGSGSGSGSTVGGGSGSAAGSAAAAAQGTGLAGVSGDEPIEVGVPYTANGEQANAALGAAAITRGNEKADAQAVIEEINAKGGINGRRLRPVYFAYDATSSDTAANQDQAACSHFTEDNHIAVSMGTGLTPVMYECLARAGVLMLSSGSIIDADNATLRRYPYFFQLGTMSQERMMADQVNTLKRLRYFGGWDTVRGQASATPAKVGILTYDVPTWQRPLSSTMLPALARAGYPVDSENVYAVYQPANTSEVSRTAADVNNATLRFRQNGVTHVIVLDASALLTLLFAQSARQQNYRPRIGMNSATGAQALKDAGAVDNSFFNGAVGLGWLPIIDLRASEGEKYATAATRSCLDIMKRRTGQTFTSTNAAGLALSKCDMGFLMATALRNAGSNPTLDRAQNAIEAIGGGYQSPFIPSTFFSPTRHDAADLGFDMKWDTGCSCTRYVGKHRVP
jgi:ABC-type branched-subunit amino acid transport system substrate-binding protein